ncbi:protein borderless [Papilio machaon]|uniref:protein borderless n=1 Tax=Papilio machaon TaxID=76193 RepID=UPI001E664286|nr:protein borderless [Papilio machaon]
MALTWRTVTCAALLVAAAASLLPLETERLRATVGGYAVMNCHLDFPFGNEIPYHLQWDKDGETILSWLSGEGAVRVADRWGGRVRRVGDGGGPAGLGRGSINVSAVRETDAGLYRCRVLFPNRSPPARNNGTFYYLEVDGGNLIVTPPMNTTVVEGERAELECAPRAAGADVQWRRAGGGDAPTAAPNGSLVLLHAAAADLGEYECLVRAPDGQLQTASAFLDVHYKAKVVYSPKERYLAAGKAASLDCHFSANPPLTNLRWEKDGFLFDPYNVPGVFYSMNGSLLFNRVDESHEGVYSCTPYNALGTEGASGGVRVRVLRAPRLSARPQPLYVARLGDTLTLPCAVAEPPHHAAPAPALRWTRKDGSSLPEGRHSLRDGNLTISELAEEDRGVYVCTASNEAADVVAETELLIENVPPRAPYNLTARPTSRTIHLSWVPGGSGVDAEYTVWYRERGAGGEWRTMRLLSRGVAEATLLGLRSAADYELRVLAQDHLGDGLFSKPLVVRTLDSEISEDLGTASAAAITESDVTASGEVGEVGDVGDDGEEMEVTVRLIEEGALVRWSRAPHDHTRCSVRWYRGEARDPLAAAHTHHDYLLVSEVEEGAEYLARVWCASGARGGAALRVPQYTRMRGVAAGAAAAALLLAAAAGALWAARHRLCRAPRTPRTHRDKR